MLLLFFDNKELTILFLGKFAGVATILVIEKMSHCMW